MFALFERLLRPTAIPRDPEPPPGLVAFYWHFARQAKGLFAGLFAAGFALALLDSLIPVFMGRVVTLITSSAPETLFAGFWPMLLGMALVLLVLRPLALTAQNIMANQAIAAKVGNLIRWQRHWHVVRQSWAFFQNDFAGRIANRVMHTGPAIRESLVALLTAVWYILVYGTSALLLLAAADCWLPLPIVLWLLSAAAAHVRAARARPLQGHVGGALAADRADRRQLHQHTDGEAVRARLAGRRLCAPGDGPAYRQVPRVAAAQHAVRPHAVVAQRPHGDEHRRAGAGLADHQHLGLGGLAGDLDLRECRGRAGRHDDHCAADHPERPAAGARACGHARRDRVRGRALPLRPQEISQ